MSKTIRRTIDPKVLKGHPPLNKSPRAIMEPRMDTNGWEGTTNGHERHERIIQNHEWTRMGTNRWEGTTKHTNGHERKTQNHEWTRMDTNRWGESHEWTRMDTNGWGESHEWTRMDTNGWEGTTNGHERTRMDTNGWEGATKHTKYTKGKLRTMNGHEWTRMGGREPRNTRKARKDNPEDFVPPNDLFCRQRPGGCREWRLHSIIHKR